MDINSEWATRELLKRIECDFPETPLFVERSSYRVPEGEFAVYDPRHPEDGWRCYPKRYCRGAKIIKCHVCGKPATHVDAQFPAFTDGNVCDEHYKGGKGKK